MSTDTPSTASSETIRRMFTAHPVNIGQDANMQSVRAHAGNLACVLERLVPQGPELTRALEKLDEAVMLANAGIARPRQSPRPDADETLMVVCEGLADLYGRQPVYASRPHDVARIVEVWRGLEHDALSAETIMIEPASLPPDAIQCGPRVHVCPTRASRYVNWRGAWRAMAEEVLDRMRQEPRRQALVCVDGGALERMTYGCLVDIFDGRLWEVEPDHPSSREHIAAGVPSEPGHPPP